jgi:hypothetical protein
VLWITLREDFWWTIKDFATALDISKEEAQEKVKELLVFKILEEVGTGRYRFTAETSY